MEDKMSLPDSYTVKYNAIPGYFDAILNAQPPERFSVKFLEKLGFTSTNDRLFIGILKDLGFLNADSVPQQRYFDFLDHSQSQRVLADGIRESYSDLFAVNKKVYELSAEDAKSKLRALYAGKKTDLVIGHIAKTFVVLCQYADFSQIGTKIDTTETMKQNTEEEVEEQSQKETDTQGENNGLAKAIKLDSLQYHINIVLPESRDQAVYDAIFKSLKEHLR